MADGIASFLMNLTEFHGHSSVASALTNAISDTSCAAVDYISSNTEHSARPSATAESPVKIWMRMRRSSTDQQLYVSEHSVLKDC